MIVAIAHRLFHRRLLVKDHFAHIRQPEVTVDRHKRHSRIPPIQQHSAQSVFKNGTHHDDAVHLFVDQVVYLLYELAFYIVDVAQYRIDLQPVEFPADEKRKAGHERVANVIHEQPYGIQLLFPKIACGLLGHIAVLGDDLIDALTRYLVYIGIAVEHAGNRCNRNA